MLKALNSLENLTIIEGMVENLIVENNTIKGIILANNTEILCDALILTTGTYLRSKILVGSTSKEEGPHGEKRSNNLSNVLKSYGFEIKGVHYTTQIIPEEKANKLMEELRAKGYHVSKSRVPWTEKYQVNIIGHKNNVKKFYKDIDGKLYKMF